MFVFWWWIGRLADRIKVYQPRLQLTDEMQNFHIVAEPTDSTES